MKLQIENQRLHTACSKIIKAMSFARTPKSNISVLIEADRNRRTLKLTGTNFTAASIPTIIMTLQNVDVFESGCTVMTLSELIELTQSLESGTDCNADNAG